MAYVASAACAAAIAAGSIYGHEFGHRVSGPLLGIIAAVNTAAIGAVCVGTLIEQLKRLLAVRRKQP